MQQPYDPPSPDELRGLRWTRQLAGHKAGWDEPTFDIITKEMEKLFGANTYRDIWVSWWVESSHGAYTQQFPVELVAQDGTSTVRSLRISLPVDPKYKVRSEIATRNWVARNTSLPLPEVVTYRDNRDDTVMGFEWIMFKPMNEGEYLEDNWRKLDWTAKEKLVRQFAVFSAETFNQQFCGIGNLYEASDEEVQVGRLVSKEFFCGDRVYNGDVSRGPFASTWEWISARLAIQEQDYQATLASLGEQEDISAQEDLSDADKEEKEVAETALQILQGLRNIFDDVFPTDEYGQGSTPENTMLFNDHFSHRNFVLDIDGNITGVADWECVSVLPLWKACSIPSFLDGPTREHAPYRDRYEPWYAGEEEYWEDRTEYELTKLRKYFLSQVEKMTPKDSWARIYRSSGLQRDFDYALQHCDNGVMTEKILEWLEDVGKETDKWKVLSLEKRRWLRDELR